MFNPINSIAPSLLGLAQQQNLFRFMNPYATGYRNSSMSSSSMSNPYTMSNPYMASSSGSGGMNSGSYSGMGTSAANSSGYSQGKTSAAATVDQTSIYAGMELGSLLTAFGISNKNGQLEWPLAFRLIPPGEDRESMMQTESVVQIAVMQAAGGKVALAVLEEATRDVRKMRHWLRDHEVNIADGTYRAGSAFLRRIEGALKIMGSY